MAAEAYPSQPTHPMPGDDEDDSDGKAILMENKSCGYRTCSILAHNKMIFHSLKHLSRPVFGLLIGISYKEKEKSYIHVMDIIPLQHNFFSAMVVEIAFLQIEEWLNNIGSSNLRILGVYFANSHCDDVSKNTSAIIIAQQLIKEYSRSSTLLCEIASDRIESAYKGNDSALDWFMLRNNGDSENKKDWRDIDDILLVTTNRTNNIGYHEWLMDLNQLQLLDVENKKFNQINLKQLLKNEIEEKIYDFEDHLDDESKDWRNLQLFTL